jgi:cysteinyl-tRNA synthetase
MQLFNSYSKSLEHFSPLEGKSVVMYVCGLTPYDSAHIGHARAFVAFDMIKRFLRKRGYSVLHIQNITDVDDKIVKRCKETAADPIKLTESVHDEALELFDRLHILRADVYPKVTEHIPEIISLVETLIDRGFAYETATGVYFDVSGFERYGKLSGQDMEQIRAGSRKQVDETKDDPADFALWKKIEGIIEFDSPWGKGRPGWHIECSAMARKYGKRTLDIHGGARDLIFPHHENEIAQSEAATDEKFCNYWLHTGFLTVEGEKMSKSLGNFITIKQALARFSPNALRLFYLQAHYRSPLDYDPEKLGAMEESVERIFNSIGLIRELGEEGDSQPDPALRKKSDELIASFYRHMEDDLNTPEAIAALFSLLRLTNTHLSRESHDRDQLKKVRHAVEEMLWILGLQEKRRAIEDKTEKIFELLEELGLEKQETTEQALQVLIDERDNARAAKDYARSDMIRTKLREIGIILEDKAEGVRWKIS